MAKNLLDAGHEILVHDVFPEAVVDLKELGAATAATPSEVASKTSTIVTMLPSRYINLIIINLVFFIIYSLYMGFCHPIGYGFSTSIHRLHKQGIGF